MGPTCPRHSQGNLWDLPGIPSEKLPNLPSGPSLRFSLEIPYPSLYGKGKFCSPEIGPDRVGSGRVGSECCPRAPAPPSLLRSSLPRQRPMVREVMAKSDADGKHAKKRTQQERARDRGFHSLCESRRREFQ
jgi:hypothetical protein